MTRRSAGYRCTECDAVAAKWVGRCPACGGWNTVEPEAAPVGGGSPPLRRGAPPVRSTDAAEALVVARPTGIGEFDRVLDGGLVAGSVTLVGGEPGIGKSTLLLQAAAHVARAGGTALYVSGEESVGQVRARARRLGAVDPALWLAAEHDVDAVIAEMRALGPDLVVVDSIQTMTAAGTASAPGSVGQVRECAHRLAAVAKESGVALVLVGHVTKDGSLAGPRQLEHLVDTVLSFEGDRHHALRLLRTVKHRFGPTSGLGLFEMGERGLVDLPDAARLFLADRQAGVAGSTVFPLLEGQRSLLVEVQALVVPSTAPAPRRSTEGVDASRLALLLAVLGRRLGLPVLTAEVYALAVGGVRLDDPAADLAVALAVISATTGIPVPDDVLACGEVGLVGEVRSARQLERRLVDAHRAGFRRVLVAAGRDGSVPAESHGLRLVPVATLADAIEALELVPSRRGRRSSLSVVAAPGGRGQPTP